MQMPREQLHEMGERGRRWVTQEFAWERVAWRMHAVYTWMRGASEPPPDVRFL